MMHFSCYNIKKNIIQYLIKCDHFLTIIYISHHNTIKVLKTKTKKKKRNQVKKSTNFPKIPIIPKNNIIPTANVSKITIDRVSTCGRFRFISAKMFVEREEQSDSGDYVRLRGKFLWKPATGIRLREVRGRRAAR